VFPTSSGLASLFLILALAWLIIAAVSFAAGFVGLAIWLTRPDGAFSSARLTWVGAMALLLLLATVVETLWMAFLVLRAASDPSLFTEMDSRTRLVFQAPVAQLPVAFGILLYAVYRKRSRRP
jgi:hypothetical protein